jgi:hypothetical protein
MSVDLENADTEDDIDDLEDDQGYSAESSHEEKVFVTRGLGLGLGFRI